LAGLGPSRVPSKPLGEGCVRGIASPCHEGLLGFERPPKFGFDRQKDRLRVSFVSAVQGHPARFKPAPAGSASRSVMRLLGTTRRARVAPRRHAVSGGKGATSSQPFAQGAPVLFIAPKFLNRSAAARAPPAHSTENDLVQSTAWFDAWCCGKHNRSFVSGQLFLHRSRQLMQLSGTAVSTPPTPQPSRLGSMLRRRQQIACWHFDSPLDCDSLACSSLAPKRRRCDR
jgi:hypothetical protein